MTEENKNNELAKQAEAILNGSLPSEIEQGFVAFNTMYTELMKSGFNRNDALWIVGYGIWGPPDMRDEKYS